MPLVEERENARTLKRYLVSMNKEHRTSQEPYTGYFVVAMEESKEEINRAAIRMTVTIALCRVLLRLPTELYVKLNVGLAGRFIEDEVFFLFQYLPK